MTILRIKDVKKQTGLSPSTIYAMIAEDKFPKQIKLSTRSSGWLQSEITDWIESKVADRDGGAV